MSFMRDIEYKLRKDKTINIEDEIPFWEFLDIEYEPAKKTFYLKAHYKQKPSFPEMFKRLIGSPTIHKIDDELGGKELLKIYPQDWKPREELDFELGAENVLYTLIDTTNKLLYVGQAERLVDRLKVEHPTIKNWNYYRYDVLPSAIKKNQRVILEQMMIREFASLFMNKASIDCKNISEYHLVRFSD